MKIKLTIAAVLLVAFSFTDRGDESWLMPDKFFYQKGEEAKISVQSGENFIGEASILGKHHLDKVMYITRTTRTDLKMSDPESEKPLQITLTQEGTHIVTVETDVARLTKEAVLFNQYLKNYGLDEVYYTRETGNALDAPAQIEQVTFHKLILQVGIDRDDVSIEPVGFPIEIVPHNNPYALKQGDPIGFTLLAGGKPLFGARVRIWNRFNNRTTIQQIYTEQDGSVRTHLSNPGPWMVTAVQMEPSPQKAGTWRSYTTTLVFGVK